MNTEYKNEIFAKAPLKRVVTYEMFKKLYGRDAQGLEMDLFNELVTAQSQKERLVRALKKMVEWYGGMADGDVEQGAEDAVRGAQSLLTEIQKAKGRE